MTVRDINVRGKRSIVTIDFNVPIEMLQHGEIVIIIENLHFHTDKEQANKHSTKVSARSVDVFVTDKNKLLYSICIGYKDYNSNSWVNKRVTLSEYDLPKLIQLLHLACIYPKNRLLRKVEKKDLN